MKKIVAFIPLLICLLFLTKPAFAACENPIYGGGTACPTAQELQIVNNTKNSNPTNTTTEGGLKVEQAGKLTNTPPTGAEALPLFSLMLIGLAGIVIKAKYSFKNV
jgi:hypothetical protein